MIRIYILSGVAATFLVLLGALWWQMGRVDALNVLNAALTTSVAALTLESELSRDAQAVANARADWFAKKANEYDSIREGILRDGENANLPDWLTDVVDGLRLDPDSETD